MSPVTAASSGLTHEHAYEVVWRPIPSDQGLNLGIQCAWCRGRFGGVGFDATATMPPHKIVHELYRYLDRVRAENNGSHCPGALR